MLLASPVQEHSFARLLRNRGRLKSTVADHAEYMREIVQAETVWLQHEIQHNRFAYLEIAPVLHQDEILYRGFRYTAIKRHHMLR